MIILALALIQFVTEKKDCLIRLMSKDKDYTPATLTPKNLTEGTHCKGAESKSIGSRTKRADLPTARHEHLLGLNSTIGYIYVNTLIKHILHSR